MKFLSPRLHRLGRLASFVLFGGGHTLKKESPDISKVQGRMSKDLARITDSKKSCPFALVVKALSKYDTEGSGFVKVMVT